MGRQIIIVGAGLWGGVFAERITKQYACKVIMIETSAELGGACQSRCDDTSGIECHRFGTHVFHTSLPHVWNYVCNFSEFTYYRHKVFTKHANQVYTLPINLGTINAFYGKNFTPAGAENFLKTEIKQEYVASPANLEENAISLVGRPLYEAFIRGYTQKQWARDPQKISPEIINRLPIRLNYNNDYFNDYWQGLPKEGYFTLFKNLLSDSRITIKYHTDFFGIRAQLPKDALIIYTGLPDMLFDYKYGELEWRSLRFEWEHLDMQDFQGTSVMNYADVDVPYTRIHEFKHLHPERTEPFNSNKTVISREFPQKWRRGEPAYYPVNNKENNDRYELYRREAEKAGIILGGRLGKYKYFDMDKCIDDALKTFDEVLPRYLTS